jgi:hypothetical protein
VPVNDNDVRAASADNGKIKLEENVFSAFVVLTS